MLQKAAAALGEREQQVAELSRQNDTLVKQAAALQDTLTRHVAQMGAVTDLLEQVGFDVGDKVAFTRGLVKDPAALPTVLKSAFDHFSHAPTSGRGVQIDRDQVDLSISKWRV